MENKLRNKHTHTCMRNSHTPTLAMHKDSQTISKAKPNKIRIIHIFAPLIIKTDVENFRELVQRITGKPSDQKCCKNKKPIIVGGTAGSDQESRRSSSISNCSGLSEDKSKLMELRNGGFRGLDQSGERVKEKVGFFSHESSEGYLGGFSDLEGFISSELGEFPLLPLDGNHVQGFEESQIL